MNFCTKLFLIFNNSALDGSEFKTKMNIELCLFLSKN